MGKSILAQLIATSYAQHEQRVGLFHFNIKQKTALFWAHLHEQANISLQVTALEGQRATLLRSDRRFDVAVADGRPGSYNITLSLARVSDFVVINTSFTADDLISQRRFILDMKQIS